MTDKTTSGMLVQYVTGFILSLLLTLISYYLVSARVLSGTQLIMAISALALVQMLVQLVLFLHVADGEKPRLKLIAAVFMAILLLIVVVGSLWIMHNLNYNMLDLSPSGKTDYMLNQKDKGF